MPIPAHKQCSQIFTWSQWYQGLPRTNRPMPFLALEVCSCISTVLQGTGCPLPFSLLSAFMTQFATETSVSALEGRNSQLLTPNRVGQKGASMKLTLRRACASIQLSILPALFTWIHSKGRIWSNWPTERENPKIRSLRPMLWSPSLSLFLLRYRFGVCRGVTPIPLPLVKGELITGKIYSTWGDCFLSCPTLFFHKRKALIEALAVRPRVMFWRTILFLLFNYY